MARPGAGTLAFAIRSLKPAVARAFSDPARALPPIASALALAWLLVLGPPRAEFQKSWSTALYDRRGELLGAVVSAEGSWRFPPGRPLPERYIEALLTYEDRLFRSHAGVDPAALARAFLQNAREGRIVSGGSTITMQAARLARPGSARNLGEKIAEALLALRLELLLGKAGVLALYAENAPFGGNVVGLEAASFRFFGRSPDSLSWAEATALAVLPNAPSIANPGRNRDLLAAKRDRLLRALRDRGIIAEADLALALAEPLPSAPFSLPRLAPQLVDRYASAARAAARARPSAPGASRRSAAALARVETTLDAALQERASAIASRRLEALESGGVRNLACIVARVDSGEVLAYMANAPGRGPGPAGAEGGGYALDLVRAARSSGSLFKPFLYAAALDSGELGPRALLPDLPTRFGSYGPENNSGTWSGAARADEALARSLNVPFVRLLASFGVERFRDILVQAGISTLTRPAGDYGLTLILGGAEASLWELAGLYAGLARSAYPPAGAGRRPGEQLFELGLTRGELELRRWRIDPFSRGSAALTLDALTRVARPAEEAAWEDFASARRIAWKTGTSYGYRDAWAIGTDGAFVVGVWAGNASGEGRPGLRGSAAAAPLLFELFGLLAAGGAAESGGAEDAATADRVMASAEDTAADGAATVFRAVAVCADSGWAAGPDCARVETALLPAGARPLRACPYCASIPLSQDGEWRVRAEDEIPGSVKAAKRFVLPPAMEAYYRRGHFEYAPLPPWRPGSKPVADAALALTAPEGGASLYIPVELTGRPGATVFSAAHRDGSEIVFWHLDGEYLGSTRGIHSLELRPGAGEHTLTVVDGEGREVSRRFIVLSER